MILEQILILSIIQGLTEFLPVSSSGHLILVPHIFKWPDQGRAFDVAVHVGTLGAVFVYFWKDIVKLIQGFFNLVTGRITTNTKMLFGMALATLPAVFLGLAISVAGIEMRSMAIVGITSVVFGFLLYWVDQRSPATYTLAEMTYKRALLVGCAQALALIPGTSRSGACMTMGRYLGFNRLEAARFAFLLSIPSIIAAATLTSYKLLQEGESIFTPTIGLGVLFSFIAGFSAIYFMMRWLRNSSFTPFVIYRFCLGITLILWSIL